MDGLNLVFCILCIVCGILTFIGAILWMTAATSFVSVVLGIYLMFVFFLSDTCGAFFLFQNTIL